MYRYKAKSPLRIRAVIGNIVSDNGGYAKFDRVRGITFCSNVLAGPNNKNAPDWGVF